MNRNQGKVRNKKKIKDTILGVQRDELWIELVEQRPASFEVKFRVKNLKSIPLISNYLIGYQNQVYEARIRWEIEIHMTPWFFVHSGIRRFFLQRTNGEYASCI